MSCWPRNVGIAAIEVYFPSLYVDQAELEAHDGASPGKYTVGLGQRRMGFCNDREDVHSLCLTVVRKLLDSYRVDPKEIGRLEVGTETILDKSKSVKSVLMQLFEPHGVTDLEGVDTTNACYGGTAALFNSIAWMESSAWNGRYALVVAADIAVYAKGAARPTGGAGAVAMLISPDAPLVFDRGVRSTYVRHVYDFYKPDLASEYPTVDGRLSVRCYLDALDTCYRSYCENAKPKGTVTLDSFDYVLFHAPYCKLVQKSLARVSLNDFLRTPDELKPEKFPGSDRFARVDLADSYFDKDLEKAFMAYSSGHFASKTEPSLLLATEVGNMYTPSLYAGLVSCLMCDDASRLLGKKILLFSYGSGLASSMFSITVADGRSDLLDSIVERLGRARRLLEQREKLAPEQFEATLTAREEAAHGAPYEPSGGTETFFPGTYYLERVDEKHRRFYGRVPVAQNGHA